MRDYLPDGVDFFGVVAESFAGVKNIRRADGTLSDDPFGAKSIWNWFKDGIERTALYNDTGYYFILNDTGTSSALENIRYDDNVIELLNTYGLRIYYYETLILDVLPKKKFSSLTNAAQYLPQGFENTTDNLKNMYCLEFESVEIFIKNNNLNNVTFCTSEYKIAEYLQDRYSFKIEHTGDILLAHQLNESTDCFGFKENYKNYFTNTTIIHKFYSSNWRYTKHRKIICSDLVTRNSLISWAFDDDLSDVQLPEPYMSRIQTGNDQLQSLLPLCIDIPFKKTSYSISNEPDYVETGVLDPYVVSLPIEYYSKCFCAIINESEFYRPTPVVTEKTINAIKAGRPFIIVGAPHCLEYLQNLGFKTFNDFWDEGYDTELDHISRLTKIIDIINNIDQLTIEELQQLYDTMLPLIKHNFNHLFYLRDMYTSL